MAQPPTAQPYVVVRRPRRRRFGLWQPILGFLLILLVVLAVADRVAAAAAAAELRSRVATELAARNIGYASLDVSVGGVPFLTQIAQERYESLAIDMTQVRLSAGGREAVLPELQVIATGVQVDTLELAQGNASAVAEQVTGTAVISYEALSDLIDVSQYHLVNISFHERDGALWATADVSALGFELPIEAAAEVSVHDGQIEVRLRNATAVGISVPEAALPVLDLVMNAALVAIVPPLPFSITIDDFEIAPEGLGITATGRDVTLAGPG